MLHALPSAEAETWLEAYRDRPAGPLAWRAALLAAEPWSEEPTLILEAKGRTRQDAEAALRSRAWELGLPC